MVKKELEILRNEAVRSPF